MTGDDKRGRIGGNAEILRSVFSLRKPVAFAQE
jgi:hypothetical protein